MIRRTKLIIVTSAVLLVIVLLSVYFVQNIYSNNDKTAYSNIVNGLRLSITVNETTHRQGDNIYATLRLTNIGNQNVSTRFIDTDAIFEFDVHSQNHIESGSSETSQFRLPTTLAPNGSINKTINWLTDAPYYYPPAGKYQFVGQITNSNHQTVFRTAPLKITLTTVTTPTS
jgi:hypothetical protein